MEGTSNNEEIAPEFLPFLRVYKDGRVERLLGTEVVPPSIEDPKTGVSSKDVVIIPETGVSARLYVPKLIQNNRKLPLLVYFHGGGFCIETAFSPIYHYYLNDLVSQANVAAVSVDYRRAPEHYLPIAYDDSWAALNWVLSHSTGGGSESWLSDYADFDQVFLGGDSAGANIAHNMAVRAGTNPEQIHGVKIVGVAIVHPYFCNVEAISDGKFDIGSKDVPAKLWHSVCPSTTGCDDPRINPTADMNLSRLGCDRVLVFVAEKDILKDIGWVYFEAVKNCGWGGAVDIMESEGEDHVFHLINPTVPCLGLFTVLKD